MTTNEEIEDALNDAIRRWNEARGDTMTQSRIASFFFAAGVEFGAGLVKKLYTEAYEQVTGVPV